MALLTPQSGGATDNDNIRRLGPRRPTPVAPGGPIIGDLWYDTSELNLKAWNGSIWQTIGGSFSIQPPARVGPSPAGAYGSGYASFDHTGRAYNSTGNYIILADTINSFLNAPAGGGVFLRLGNSNRLAVSDGGIVTYGTSATECMVIDTNTARSNFGFTQPQGLNFYVRGFGDTNHRLFVPGTGPAAVTAFNSVFNLDGPCLVGFSGPTLVNQSQWRLHCFSDGHVAVQGKLSIGTFGSQDAFADGESLTTAGGLSGISFKQRARANNDGVNRCVIYPGDTAAGFGGQGLYIWQNGDLAHFAQGQNFHIPMGVPNLGALIPMVISGVSQQVGVNTSSGAHKENVRTLKATPEQDSGENSPIFKLRPVRFTWKQRAQDDINGDGVVNATEINKAHPNGYAGLIAEEVREIAPDAVVVVPATPEWRYNPDIDPIPSQMGPDGGPLIYRPATKEKIAGVDNDRLIAYLVDAVQHLKNEIDRLKREK